MFMEDSKFQKLYKKYKDLIPYVFFGVLTTIVNIVIYALCAKYIGWGTIVSTVIAWIAAVLFAYITNRKWVFHSKAKGIKAVCVEIISFFTCRLLTGLLDVGIMRLFVDILGFNDVIIKAVSNILVIVVNYIASKLVIFKKKNM